MKPRLVVALTVSWPWLLIVVIVMIKGPQLYGLVLGFYIQASLFWVIPAVLIWALVEVMAVVRKRNG